MDFKDNQTEMDWVYLNKFVLGSIRGGLFQYILIENSYRYGLNCYSAFSYKFPILILRVSIPFYTIFTSHLHPPHADQIIGVGSYPINTFLKSLGSSCKAGNHCSGITFSLMRPESQLGCIQCGGSSFSQDILGFSSILCSYNAYLCPQNFLNHSPGRQTTSTDLGFGQPMRHSSSALGPTSWAIMIKTNFFIYRYGLP